MGVDDLKKVIRKFGG